MAGVYALRDTRPTKKHATNQEETMRTLYTLCLVALIGSTAWAATELKAERQSSPGRVGFVLLTMLQR